MFWIYGWAPLKESHNLVKFGGHGLSGHLTFLICKMTSHDYMLKVHMTVGWSSLHEVFTMLRLVAINIVNAEITFSNLPCDLRLVT